MSTRSAEPLRVPFLKAKLGALYVLSRDIDGHAALARKFASAEEPDGITPRAIRHWIDGDGVRDANEVPASRLAQLVEVFRKRLPGDRSEAETRAMLLSPTARDLLVAFLSVGPESDWISQMLAAAPSTACLVPAMPRGSLAITTRGQPLDAIEGGLEYPVRRPFRLKLPGTEPGWIALIQWGRSGCFGVELDTGVVSLERSASEMLLPLSRPYFDEDEPGLRRYIFLAAKLPFPPDILSRLATSARTPAALDAGTMDRLAHLAESMGGFELTALDVRFFEPGA